LPSGDILIGCKSGEVVLVSEDSRHYFFKIQIQTLCFHFIKPCNFIQIVEFFYFEPGGGYCRKFMEKSRRLVKASPLTAVYDVADVAALITISSNPIWLSTWRLLGQGKGESYRSVSVL
jgi:hypothetical protein